MFEALKKKRKDLTKNVTAWVLFTLIILVFVFWGLNPGNQMFGVGGSAAQVNGEAVTLAEWQQKVEELRRDPFIAQFLETENGRQRVQVQALEQLISLQLALQGARANHVTASDAEIREMILNTPEFQKDGRFSSTLYFQLLEANGLKPASFEARLRKQQTVSRLFRTFNSGLNLSSEEIKRIKEVADTKVNVEFLSLMTESVVAPEKVAAADAQAFLKAEANAPKLKEYYDTHKDEFSTPEEVKARHILVRFEKGNATSEKAAEEKIKGIAERVKKGDFAKIAKEVSEDPGSKDKGGDLGFFARGRMVPEFENAAFTLPTGQISAPIKTDYGFHLIQVQDKKAAHETTFDEGKEKIARILIAKEKSKAVIDEMDQAVKSGSAQQVEKLASTHGLKWQETGFFNLEAEMVPKVGYNEEFANIAFQVNPSQPMAKTLVRQAGQAFVVRYKGTQTAADKESGADPEMMAQRLASEAFSQWIESLRVDANIKRNAQIAQ